MLSSTRHSHHDSTPFILIECSSCCPCSCSTRHDSCTCLSFYKCHLELSMHAFCDFGQLLSFTLLSSSLCNFKLRHIHLLLSRQLTSWCCSPLCWRTHFCHSLLGCCSYLLLCVASVIAFKIICRFPWRPQSANLVASRSCKLVLEKHTISFGGLLCENQWQSISVFF